MGNLPLIGISTTVASSHHLRTTMPSITTVASSHHLRTTMTSITKPSTHWHLHHRGLISPY